MFINENTSRQDLEMCILEDEDLYKEFDEVKFINGTYSDEELRDIICAWIEEGDECYGS